MKWKSGERLRCSNPECRLEVVVLSVGAGKEPDACLTYHCGSPMKRSYEKPAIHTTKLGGGDGAKP